MSNDIRITKAVNGFTLRYTDKDIEAKNRQSEGRYRDPQREAVFTKKDEMLEWLGENLDELTRAEPDKFSEAFDTATEGSD